MTRFNGEARRVECTVDEGPIFQAIASLSGSTLLFLRGGTIARWRQGEEAVSSKWKGFMPLHERGMWPTAFLLDASGEIVVADPWFVWVWSADGRKYQRASLGAQIRSIAPVPAERIAAGCHNGRIHILRANLAPEATCIAPVGSVWDLVATDAELIVGQERSVSFFSFAGNPVRPLVSLSAMLLRLNRFGPIVLAGLSTDEVGRVDRGAFESLGKGLVLGMSASGIVILRANHRLERLPIETDLCGIPRAVSCPEIDQPFLVVSSEGARGDAVVGRHAVTWLPHYGDQTTSEWIAPMRIESCVALDGGGLLVTGNQELWVLEGYLLQ